MYGYETLSKAIAFSQDPNENVIEKLLRCEIHDTDRIKVGRSIFDSHLQIIDMEKSFMMLQQRIRLLTARSKSRG